jgi:hypothetical protein
MLYRFTAKNSRPAIEYNGTSLGVSLKVYTAMPIQLVSGMGTYENRQRKYKWLLDNADEVAVCGNGQCMYTAILAHIENTPYINGEFVSNKQNITNLVAAVRDQPEFQVHETTLALRDGNELLLMDICNYLGFGVVFAYTGARSEVIIHNTHHNKYMMFWINPNHVSIAQYHPGLLGRPIVVNEDYKLHVVEPKLPRPSNVDRPATPTNFNIPPPIIPRPITPPIFEIFDEPGPTGALLPDDGVELLSDACERIMQKYNSDSDLSSMDIEPLHYRPIRVQEPIAPIYVRNYFIPKPPPCPPRPKTEPPCNVQYWLYHTNRRLKKPLYDDIKTAALNWSMRSKIIHVAQEKPPADDEPIDDEVVIEALTSALPTKAVQYALATKLDELVSPLIKRSKFDDDIPGNCVDTIDDNLEKTRSLKTVDVKIDENTTEKRNVVVIDPIVRELPQYNGRSRDVAIAMGHKYNVNECRPHKAMTLIKLGWMKHSEPLVDREMYDILRNKFIIRGRLTNDRSEMDKHYDVQLKEYDISTIPTHKLALIKNATVEAAMTPTKQDRRLWKDCGNAERLYWVQQQDKRSRGDYGRGGIFGNIMDWYAKTKATNPFYHVKKLPTVNT